MPKPEHRSSHQSKPRDVTLVWESRGYKKDPSVGGDSRGADDPQGEAAYQRAFARAASQKPPRVPNPESYPNSPSAQEYIRHRNQELFPSMKPTKVRSTSYMAPIPDIHRPRPKEEHASSSKSSPQSNHSSRSTPKISSTTVALNTSPSTAPVYDSRSGFHGPPQFLEPKLAAPSGPTNRLR